MGAADPEPYVPEPVFYGFTEDEVAKIVFAREDATRKHSARYRVKDFVLVSQYVQMSFQQWLDLDELSRSAIVLEVEAVANERRRQSDDEKRRMDMEIANAKAKMKMPFETGSTIQKFLR